MVAGFHWESKKAIPFDAMSLPVVDRVDLYDHEGSFLHAFISCKKLEVKRETEVRHIQVFTVHLLDTSLAHVSATLFFVHLGLIVCVLELVEVFVVPAIRHD